MALHAIDLLTPRGRLNGAALWPGVEHDDVTATLTAYLSEGYTLAAELVKPDAAARLWAYYRAWDEVYQRLLAMPSTVSTSDEGSASYMQLQIAEFGRLADDAKAGFDAMVATTLTAVAPVTRMSASVPATFRW